MLLYEAALCLGDKTARPDRPRHQLPARPIISHLQGNMCLDIRSTRYQPLAGRAEPRSALAQGGQQMQIHKARAIA